MDQTYIVTRRSAEGAPREIQCVAHEGCDWTLESAGAKRDDDPIFVMQFQAHMRSEGVGRQVHGTMRRERKRP